MAGVISTQSYVNPYQWSKQMGGGRGKSKSKSKSKTKTKAQKMAVANKAKYGGTAKAAAANKAAGKAKAKARHTASQAAKGKTTSPSKGGSISKGTTGIGPVKSGATYSKAVSKATNAPTKRTSGIGPYADGAKYAAALKASPPVSKAKFKEASLIAEAPKKINPFNIFQTKEALKEGEAAREGKRETIKNPGFLDSILNRNTETQRMINELSAKPTDTQVAASNLGELSIGPVDSGPNYFKIKSSETFGAPSQEAVDKAAGITAGGLNIGGSGFTPDKPSGSSTSRAISDGASKVSFGPVADGNEYAKNITDFGMKFGATPEARGKAYEQSLDPNSFKGLSDGMTFGVGPVASGDAYARGLNTDNKNVENRLRQVRNLGSTLTGGLIPSVRKLTDKEIADRRIKNAAFREANLVGRKRGSSGGARLPVAPLTPEEIIEEAAVAQTVPDYQQAQTGVDPNRLMQIQQEAYLQAFNPTYNPMFRFFDRRRGARRGAFRKAFRRD